MKALSVTLFVGLISISAHARTASEILAPTDAENPEQLKIVLEKELSAEELRKRLVGSWVLRVSCDGEPAPRAKMMAKVKTSGPFDPEVITNFSEDGIHSVTLRLGGQRPDKIEKVLDGSAQKYEILDKDKERGCYKVHYSQTPNDCFTAAHVEDSGESIIIVGEEFTPEVCGEKKVLFILTTPQGM